MRWLYLPRMSSDDDRIAPGRAEEMRRRLLRHYDSGKRDLPWRRETDPYRIWVSEVMLQQTRVDSVIPYYRKWVARFPTLESLAEADEEDVLRAWQGLGYYSRARRLLRAARIVRERYRGALPRSAEDLEGLPGVGEYTAGAVASIAFGEAVPAVDGNVRRVLSRLFDLSTPRPNVLRCLATELVDPLRPGDFNQAFMELGATACAPFGPACGGCPLEDLCLARARGTVEERPARKGKGPVPRVDVGVLVAVCREVSTREPSFLLRKRPGTGLLAGMWEFPGVELVDGREGARARAGSRPPGVHGSRPTVDADTALAAIQGMARGLGLRAVGVPVLLPAVPHAFSHLRARYQPFVVPVATPVPVGSGAWVQLEELANFPLPMAQQRIAASARASVCTPP